MDIQNSLELLRGYIERENYRGYDPYDALNSPLFKLPVFRSNKLIRFGSQQLVKRLPINVRPLLLVPKGINPVTLGLCIQGYSYLWHMRVEQRKQLEETINGLIDKLELLVPSGFSGACWGYNFDWEARYANIPAYQPNVVATGVITNGLFECYHITGNPRALGLCKSATRFVSQNLNRTYNGTNFCFSYSPFDSQQVFNASMKGARLLAQVYSIEPNEDLKALVVAAVQFVVNNQNPDGSWYYSLKSTGKWIDNYHTGYILDCLDDSIKLCGLNGFDESLQKGVNYYRNNFIGENYEPKFYSNSLYPIDSTSVAQCLLTLSRFSFHSEALGVARWAANNMQSSRGYFYYQKKKFFTRTTPFMRWSNAWMFAALGYLTFKTNR